MSEEAKRIINTQSYFKRGTHTHTHNYAPDQNLAEAAIQIKELLDHLEHAYPTTVEAQHYVEMKVQSHPVLKNSQAIELAIKNDPTLRDRLRAAFNAGLLEAVKVIFAPAGIPIEMVRAWLNPG
jgi:hypothetical protein